MIVAIQLRGFQSHVSTTFNLGKGLNVITGPSDAGKTAIIRAIRWVAFNEPTGEAFLNERVGEAEVKIFLENGAIITKHRKSGRTTYIIQTHQSEEGSIFEKAEVPLEVTRLLGIEKHSFGDFESALNFSFQLDAPFLISETGSAGAKVLGKLAGTESVDLAIKGVSQDTHATRNMRSNAEKDIERLTGSLFSYQHIDDAKQMVNAAEILLEKIEENYTRLGNLKEYRHHYMLAREKIQKLMELIDVLAHVPVLEEDLKDIERAQQRYDQLLQLYSDGSRLMNQISSLDQDLLRFEDIPLAADHMNSIELDVDQLTNITILRQSYQKYTQDVKIAMETLEKTKELESVEDVLNAVESNQTALLMLRSLGNEYRTTENQLNALNTRLDTFKDVQAVEETLLAAEQDVTRFTALKELQKEHIVANQLKINAGREFNRSQQELQGAHEHLKRVWASAGGVCPLCESALGGCNHD